MAPEGRKKPGFRKHTWLYLATTLLLVIASAIAQNDPNLQKVISLMDATAAQFRTAQANFIWEQFFKVVNETDTQKGTVYYRRSGKDIQMLAEITDPPKSRT